MKFLIALPLFATFAACVSIHNPPRTVPWLFEGKTPAVNGGATLEVSLDGTFEHVYFYATDLLDEDGCLTSSTVKERGVWYVSERQISFDSRVQEGASLGHAILRGKFRILESGDLEPLDGQFEEFHRVTTKAFERTRKSLLKDGLGVYKVKM